MQYFTQVHCSHRFYMVMGCITTLVECLALWGEQCMQGRGLCLDKQHLCALLRAFGPHALLVIYTCIYLLLFINLCLASHGHCSSSISCTACWRCLDGWTVRPGPRVVFLPSRCVSYKTATIPHSPSPSLPPHTLATAAIYPAVLSSRLCIPGVFFCFTAYSSYMSSLRNFICTCKPHAVLAVHCNYYVLCTCRI